MRILFLTDNFPPEVNAPAARTFEHCRRWVAAGAEVTVITCAPNFPQGAVHAGYRNRLRSVEAISGIRVVRVWTYITANEGFLKRSLDYASFAVSSFIAGLAERADVIVATSPQFFTTFAGYGLSVLKRRPWVFELRDMWPESIVTVGAMQKGQLYRVLERIELFLYRKAARIVAVTPRFRENLVARGIPAAKIDVITNGADVSVFSPRSLNLRLREKLGIADKFVVGYIGTHGMAHGLDFILNAVASQQAGNLHFLFVGDGAEKASLRAQAQSLAIANVTFCEPVAREDVPTWIAACDALLIPLRRTETFKSVIPSKIFEAASMERPILLGVDGQAREIVEGFGAGLFFEPENASAFCQAVQRMANDEALRVRFADGGRALAKAYGRDTLATRMLMILQNIRNST